jgi:SAM-dependent methyltransferase
VGRVIAINWVGDAERIAHCPACHAGDTKRHLLDVAFAASDAFPPQHIALLRCDDCGARFADPIVSVDYQDIDQDGMRYYVEQGAGIDVMLEVFSALDRRPVKRYLEVGCSFGFAMEYARRALGWEVLGFDPGFVAAAGRRMLGLPIESRLLGEGAVPQGAFDVVFCSEVIEHVSQPDAFIGILRHALSDGGILLMTTPDGDAVTPDQPLEALIPVLSPSQHVVLYNAAAIEALLRRHGFVEVRTRRNATQLQIIAARTPIGVSAAYFTRARYRAFLQAEFDAHRDDEYLTAGFGYRLLCEDVNAGSFAEARATFQRLRDAYRATYGYDIDAAAAVPIPSSEGLSLSAFGQHLPFNLCGVWHCRGIMALLGDRDPAAAADYFAAAMRVGGVLRAVLQTIGTDDISVANFCREAEIARLAALAQADPHAGLRAIRALQQNALQDPTPEAALHRARAERQFFTDLVNLGHYALAEELLAGSRQLIDEPLAFDTAPTAMAYGFYLLNHRSDPAAARKIFAATLDHALAERASRPTDARLADALQQIELGQLAALAIADSAEALPAMREVAVNRGGLDADTFAAHRLRATRQLFADLVNLGHYALAEELTAEYGPPIDEPFDLEAAPTGFAYGIYLLNHRQDAPAAREILASTRDCVLAARAAKPRDAKPKGLLEEIEIALLAASALVGHAPALAAMADISLNRGGLGADAFASHMQRVRERAADLFADLGYEA